MRSLTIKQAEKWLQRIKETDPAAYKDLGKCLRKYDQTSDELECFVKMNEALYPLPAFTQEINTFLEDGNKFVVNKGLQERLNSFLDIARNTKYELFKEIVEYVNNIANEDRQIFDLPNKDAIEVFKSGILKIVSAHPVLLAEAQKLLPLSQEEAIKQLDLKHLKNKALVSPKDDEEYLKLTQTKKMKKPPMSGGEMDVQKIRQPSKMKLAYAPNFLSVAEEKSFIKQMEKKMSPQHYNALIKIIFLYSHNVISRLQFAEILEPITGDDFQGLKDIIEAREVDRRKTSSFKPLSDIDFHILPRQTHSYVEIPSNYPHFAANRTRELEEILNNKWVSVPRGSEVTFNVRIKNLYEIALNKCEDERYEFDLVILRLKKFNQLLISIIKDLEEDPNANVIGKLNSAISLGVLQMLYRNASKDQKQVFEDSFTNINLPTVKVYLERVSKVIEELHQYKKLYAVKAWSEVAHKNFYKSLDFKNHEFKNSQKLKMRPQSFLQELNSNMKYLQSRGTVKVDENPFGDRKEFFSVLNSFQSSSRKQKCQSRVLPSPPVYDLKNHKSPSLLPAMTLAFENQQIMLISCSFVSFYIEGAPMNQAERSRCKIALREITSRLFKMKQLRMISLTQSFDEDKFFGKLLNSQKAAENNFKQYRVTHEECLNLVEENNEQSNKIPYFNPMQDSVSEHNFQPPKSNRNIVFYGSENFYVFLRYFYSLYERVIRMKEVSTDENKLKLFEILYMACIKSKESTRFQDCLNLLFHQYSYLFTTFYKIVEGVTKSLGSISLSPLQNYSFSLLGLKNEQVYLLLLNRHLLSMQSSTSRLVRVAIQLDTKLVFIHSLNPYYRFSQESLKEFNKKRIEISKRVEEFSQEPLGHLADSPPSRLAKFVNEQQYYFESYSSKLVSLPLLEDVMVGKREPLGQPGVELRKIKQMRAVYK